MVSLQCMYGFFLFFFTCIFQYWVCALCVYGLRPLRLCVLLIQWSFFSRLKKKIIIKCSRIQEYGISTCTKISAISQSPHISRQGNYKSSVQSICVQCFLHVDRSDEQWNESTKRKICNYACVCCTENFILLLTNQLYPMKSIFPCSNSTQLHWLKKNATNT